MSGIKKFKILFDRERCTGEPECCAACASAAPDFWSYSEDGKVDLNGAAFNPQTRMWELPISERHYWLNQLVAEGCPTGAISIVQISNVPRRVVRRA